MNGALINSIFYFAALLTLLWLLKKGFQQLCQTRVIYEYQVAVLFKDGKAIRTLNAGRHRIWWPARTWLVVLDTRQLTYFGKVQTVLTADSAPVKLSWLCQYIISDPLKAASSIYLETLEVALQLALRDTIANYSVDALLTEKEKINATMQERVQLAVADQGLTLHRVALKDIILPASVKSVQLELLKAKKEAQVQLERARGETAALRHLLNASKLLEEHPSLLQLRSLQQLALNPQAALTLHVEAHKKPNVN